MHLHHSAAKATATTTLTILGTAAMTLLALSADTALPLLVAASVVAATTAALWRRRRQAPTADAALVLAEAAMQRRWPALALAATTGDYETLASGLARADAVDNERRARLVGLALENQHYDAVAAPLIAAFQRVDPEWVNIPLGEAGFTVLHIAASSGNATIVGLLLSAGADPHAVDASGQSPLFMACSGGHLTVVVALLHAGALPTARSRTMKTPMHFAAHNGHTDVIAALLAGTSSEAEREVALTAGDVSGYQPLHAACIGGSHAAGAPDVLICLPP